MRVALISPYDWAVDGGVKSHVRHLAAEFRDRGHDVDVFAPSSDRLGAANDSVIVCGRPLTVPAGGSKARIALGWARRSTRDALEAGPYDIVHAHEPLMPLVPIQFIAAAHCAIVGTFHAAREGRHPLYRAAELVGRRWLNRVDGHIAVSKAARGLARRYVSADFEIIPNGIDYHHFARPAEPARDLGEGPTILFVGRPEPRKGLTYLLEAFARIRTVAEGAPRLVIVGAGDFRAYEAAAPPGTVFRPHVDYGELPSYYQAADVVVAPNTGNESQGYVLLEAMAAGRAVVASNIPGFRTVVTDGNNGALVPPRNSKAIADRVLGLLADPGRRDGIGAAAAESARRYDWKRVASEVLDFYEVARERHRLRIGGVHAP